MKFKDLLNSNDDFSIKRKYRDKVYKNTIDFSKCIDTIDDIGVYCLLFVDHKYWEISAEMDNGKRYGYFLDNFENHPEIIYEILKYIKKDFSEYLSLYHKLPEELKLKLELEEN